MKEEFKPYVPEETNLKEFTIKAMVSGAIFGIIFGAANAYIGLYVGLTVSTSIPLAVIAVAWLKSMQPFFGKPSILEYNQIQTAGSASSSLASGVIFTIPALFIWGFNPGIFQMGMLAMLGGLLGVLFMIPLRKYLIVQEHGKLPYPEGIATSQVLISADVGGSKAKNIFIGMGVGAVFKFCYGFLQLWTDKVAFHLPLLKKAEIGIKPWPMLMGIGYILNFRIAAIMVSGGLISWVGIIPIIAYFGEGVSTPMFPEAVLPIADMPPDLIWERYIRYIGAGAVAAAGIITVIKSFPVMMSSLAVGIKQMRASTSQNSDSEKPKRTQVDLPMKVVLVGTIAIVLILGFVPGILGIGITTPMRILAAICIAIFAFCFVTVSSRIVGFVGVTSNPTSGMTIVTLLGTATVFYLLGWTDDIGKTTALTVGTVVAIAASIAGDTSQDLKCGYIIGASPDKQQIGELIGVITSAFFIVASVWLLGTVYTFGSPDLPAPQATLIKTVIEGVMQADLPWGLVLCGATFGICAELLGLPSLAFAVGMYIPLSTWTPIFVGGVIRYFVEKSAKGDEVVRKDKEEKGVLLGSGLIAGEGVIAVIISLYAYIAAQKPQGVSWALTGPWSTAVSMLMFAAVGFFLVHMTRQKKAE